MRPSFVLAFVLISAMLGACSKPATDNVPVVTVYKSPTCQCCSRWVTHLQEHGFAIKIESERDLVPVRVRLGVPDKLAACHTAVVNGYWVEGHVPAEDIQRLVAEKPKAKGIAVPRMPIGSPGMEMGDRRDPYDVVLFDEGGNTQVFAQHGVRLPAETPGTAESHEH